MWKKISAILIPTAIALAIIVWMLVRVWDDLLVAIEHASLPFLILAVLVCSGAWALRGWRYRYILKGLEIKIGLWFSTACIFVSQTANLIIPARLGDLVRLFILRHEVDATYSRGFSSLVVERAFDIVMIALLGLITLPYVLNVPDWFVTVIIVPIVCGALFILVLLMAGRLHTENRIILMVLGLFDEIRQASLNLTAFGALSAISIVIWLTDVMVCYVVALMFGDAIPFMVVVLAIVIGNLVKAVPITPGGMGTYELSVALTLELAGTAPAAATLIAVIDHLIKNLVTLAGGVVSLYFFGDWSVDLMRRAFSKGLDTEELR